MNETQGNGVTSHNSVINRVAVKTMLASEGFRCSEDLILTLEARLHVMIRHAMRGMGGLVVKTVKGEHIDRGKMRGDLSALAARGSEPKTTAGAPRQVRRGLL